MSDKLKQADLACRFLQSSSDPLNWSSHSLMLLEDTFGLVFNGTGSRNLRMFAGITSEQGEQVCNPGRDYGLTPGEWRLRNRDALRRKSAVMGEAFDNGAITATAIRRVLTFIKMHPGGVICGNSDVSLPGNGMSLCNVDPYVPGTTLEEYDREVATSRSIDLGGSPGIDHRL